MNDGYIIEPQLLGKPNSFIQEIFFPKNDFLACLSFDAEDKANLLSQRMHALRGIYDTDVPADKRQNFEITFEGKNVVLKGNLSNAFTILVENQLIAKEFHVAMLRHPDISVMLEKSKACLSEKEISRRSDLSKEGIVLPVKKCSIL